MCIIYRSFVTSWRGEGDSQEVNEIFKAQETQRTQEVQKVTKLGSPSIILYRQ